MHWGVFAISAAHLYQNYLEEPPSTSVRLAKEWILMLLIKTINLKTVDIWCFFHKKISGTAVEYLSEELQGILSFEIS